MQSSTSGDLLDLFNQPASAVRTGRDGRAVWTAPGRAIGGQFEVSRPLAGATGYGPVPSGETITPVLTSIRGSVTARPAATSVRAGTDVRVTGRANSQQVVLERRVSGRWRSVGTAYLSSCTARGCAYRLTATPPRGTWTYRVAQPASVLGTSYAASTPFTLRGR
ncbi:hypothetical protein EV189_1677 [Motilibacter rhizosphaerae]|uniref:Uncharacterized protein n=1 Tax=Motilibacter rhizosphaerae TaxID=598652 RepID=A0A4Q7NSY2_9ACTN|nr:hypothetical protein [Motilibacter rhizosphaerae]RZS89898.1 hypothetical protein EV189_1677 [Motilibacter rhizosphaerae]